MNSISKELAELLLERVSRMAINGNTHKVTFFAQLNPDQNQPNGMGLREGPVAENVYAFNIFFERVDSNSGWQIQPTVQITE